MHRKITSGRHWVSQINGQSIPGWYWQGQYFRADSCDINHEGEVVLSDGIGAESNCHLSTRLGFKDPRRRYDLKLFWWHSDVCLHNRAVVMSHLGDVLSRSIPGNPQREGHGNEGCIVEGCLKGVHKTYRQQIHVVIMEDIITIHTQYIFQLFYIYFAFYSFKGGRKMCMYGYPYVHTVCMLSHILVHF